MKLFVELQAEGKAKGNWVWVLESDSGKKLARGVQMHPTKDACAKELKAVQAEFAGTIIKERRATPATQPKAPPPRVPAMAGSPPRKP